MNWVTYTLFGITAGSSIIGAYRLFSDPDHTARERLAVLESITSTLSESVNKIMTNHLPHIDAKVTDIHGDISSVKSEVMRLATIIEERIPRSK